MLGYGLLSSISLYANFFNGGIIHQNVTVI